MKMTTPKESKRMKILEVLYFNNRDEIHISKQSDPIGIIDADGYKSFDFEQNKRYSQKEFFLLLNQIHDEIELIMTIGPN